MDEIVVSSEQRRPRQTPFQQYKPPGAPPKPETTTTTTVVTTNGPRGQQEKRYEFIDGEWVQLTAAGLPRKKPGRKPGTIMKPKTDADQAPKTRRPRKSRDAEAVTPVSRKRKGAPTDEADMESDANTTQVSTPVQRPIDATPKPGFPTNPPVEHRPSPKMAKRDGLPSSMQNLLNDDPPPQASPPSSSSIPVRTGGQSYDPIRGSYRDSSSTNALSVTGSPRAPAHNSPSIASLIEPQASPSNNTYVSRLAVPESPSKVVAKPEERPIQKPVIDKSNFTTIANGPIHRPSPSTKALTGVSTPRTDLEDLGELDGRSILDFGKAKPGEEQQFPAIVLSIPIVAGETNKYVNFMRLAEDRFGWDALHPRQAANRDRKARIAAATASLEKVEAGRESGDEMSLDMSDGEGSNAENGGTSGVDAQAKPKKKRNFKEDQYDVDDDFVDDSELLWEAQAAASRDGFFVYSGPLVPEVEKPPPGYVIFSIRCPIHSIHANLTIVLRVLLDVDAVAAAEVHEVLAVVAVEEPPGLAAVVLVRVAALDLVAALALAVDKSHAVLESPRPNVLLGI